MKKANYTDKPLIIDILSKSFDSNLSVNYIIKQDEKRQRRISELMSYSFDVCYLFGEVFLSEDNNACALIVYPDRKKTTLKTVLLDARLILKSVGLKNMRRALNREALIKKIQPKELMSYLWFIGVESNHQNRGIGSKLLDDIINFSDQQNRPLYLETSTLKNLPWYQKHGFEIYHEEDLSYRLFFLRNRFK